ncbi:helix-turn-helix domain-containing protein [Hoylesella shahii]|uniref:XRE family transcriptional regulator n=1 Tax=Hoylesella shahii TaxID=228603 RepID=UPI0028E6A3AD|nr:helix-turn-helix domain-containing protein [Hoylesella shahii]
MQNIGVKLKEYFDSKGITQKEIADSLGVSKAYVNALFNGRNSFGKEQAEKWVNLYGLSKSWLLTGEGDMLVSSNADVMNENTTYSVPLLPISAQGGSLNDFVVSVKNSECEKVISPIKGVDYAITVSGESMSPEYPSGSQVLIKKINERAFIDWGRVYVLDTCNGTVIKRLFPSDAAGCVVCKSINPEYPSFEVSMEDVYGVYRVLMCMSMK